MSRYAKTGKDVTSEEARLLAEVARALSAGEPPAEDPFVAWCGTQARSAGTWHVLGAGPSLLEFAARQDWKGFHCVATNGTPLVCKGFSHWCSVDPMPRKVLDALEPLEVPKLVGGVPGWEKDGKGYPKDSVQAPHWSRIGPLRLADMPARGLYWRTSVVQMGMELARLLGARRIVLWGVDYADNSHAYDKACPEGARPKGARWDLTSIKQAFQTLALEYQTAGIEVWNANPGSLLGIWGTIKPEKAISL